MLRSFFQSLTLIVCTVLTHAASAELRKPTIVTSSPPMQWLLQQVAGERAEVVALVAAGIEPDTFDPSPKDFKKLATAKAYFGLGMRFEQAIQIRLREISQDMRFVDLRPYAVSRLRITHSHGNLGEAHEIEDPHFWTNPVNMIRFAEVFRDEFTKFDPSSATVVKANAEKLVGDLRALDEFIRAELKSSQGKEMWVFHPAWGYFCAEYGLKQVGIETPNKEKSPRELQELIAQAKLRSIRTIFNQPQFSQSNARFFAKHIGAEVKLLDPVRADYLENMRTVTSTLKSTL